VMIFETLQHGILANRGRQLQAPRAPNLHS